MADAAILIRNALDVPASGIAITGVSGTVAQGNTLTISGSLLNNEQTANWDAFFRTTNPNAWSFEGTHPYTGAGNDGYTQPGGSPASGCSIGYDATVNLLGSKSLKMVSVEDSGFDDHGTGDCYVYFYHGLVNAFYFRGYVRFSPNTTLPTNYAKQFYCMSAGYYTDAGNHNGTHFGNFTGKTGDTSFNIPMPFTGAGYTQIEHDRWYCLEGYWSQSPARRYTIWIDGVQVYDIVPVSAGDLDLFLLGVINAQGGAGESWNFNNWMDGFTVASARVYPSTVVEIGDNPNYGVANKRYQAPTLISDGSVQVTCDLTGLGTGPYYLWVTNNAQQRSSRWNLSNLLLSETFEDSNWVARGWYDQTATPTVTASEHHDGAAALSIHFGVATTNPFTSGSLRHLVTATPTIYLAWYTKFSANWVGSGLPYHPHLIFVLNDLDADDYASPFNCNLEVHTEVIWNTSAPYGGFLRFYYSHFGDTHISDVGTVISEATKNDWHLIEAFYQMNSAGGVADGIAQTWVDGVQAHNLSNVLFRETEAQDAMLFRYADIGPWIGDGSPLDQYVWIDGLTARTARP
jgi:hypothetical protein